MFRFICFIMVFLAFPALAIEPLPGLSAQAQSTAMAGDWQALQLAFSPQVLQASPVARLLTAHAYLMVNRNNEAVPLFLTVDEAGQQAWLVWSRSLPPSPAAYYYQADALARLGDTDSALDYYDQALAADARFVPALLGKAVILAGKQDKDAARSLLAEAIKLAPGLAEPHAALGQLQLLNHAAAGAEQSFRDALAHTPDYALAHNGLGCALYGLGRWDEAEREFAEAFRHLPLPLFIGNNRALAAADENLYYLSGTEKSPLFRPTDFLNWKALVQQTLQADDALRLLLQKPLPETFDGKALADLNVALRNSAYLDRLNEKHGIPDSPSPRLMGLLTQTEAMRSRPFEKLNSAEQESILLLNRIVLEELYPLMIARHDWRDPGSQLNVMNGSLSLQNQLVFKHSLSTDQLVAGQARMDYLWRPTANVLSSSGVWPLSLLGSQWKDHLAQSTLTNQQTLMDRGINQIDTRPGGVTIDLRQAFVAEGRWPVENLFGLAIFSNQQAEAK